MNADSAANISPPADQASPVFVLSTAPVRWPAKVRVPVADGQFAVQTFNVMVKVLGEAEYDRLAAEFDTKPVPAAEDGPPPVETKADELARYARAFPAYFSGWDLQDDTGAAVPWERMPEVIAGPYGEWVAGALWVAVAEVRHGVRLGNSAAPPATG